MRAPRPTVDGRPLPAWSTPMGSSHPRKRLWVHLPYQSRLLFRLGTYLLLFVVVVLHVGFLLELMPLLADPDSLKSGFGDFYLDYLGRQKALLLALGLTLPSVLYNLLKFSHRVA